MENELPPALLRKLFLMDQQSDELVAIAETLRAAVMALSEQVRDVTPVLWRYDEQMTRLYAIWNGEGRRDDQMKLLERAIQATRNVLVAPHDPDSMEPPKP